MLCGTCGHRWVTDLDWIDRWEQAKAACPGCGTTCEREDSPRVTVDHNDPARDDDQVARFSWYHTSTQRDWPTRDFDPAAVLTRETRLMMGGDEAVTAWAARQRAKALDEVCPTGIDVARYLNYHEDPGGLSLALGRDAIAEVQQVAVPLPDAWDESWVRDAVTALKGTSETIAPTTGRFSRFMRPSSPRAALGNDLGTALANRLPVNLRGPFASAATFAEGEDPARWARRASGIFDLIENPGRVIKALDESEHRRM